MAETPKVLAQLAPAATTRTALYTVPSSTNTVTSTLFVCNRNSSNIKFSVAVAVANAADDPKQYLYYDLTLTKNDTFGATVGLTLAASDVVYVYSDTSNVAFTLMGVEVT